MAAIHIFLNENEIRQAIQQYLLSKGVEVSVPDIYFTDQHSRNSFTLEAEAMNATLTDAFKGFDK